jgi:hypothetical protein
MFRALLAHLQEALHKQRLVYCVRVMPVACYHNWSGTQSHSNPGSSQQTFYQLFFVQAPPEDEQVMLETYRGC